MTLTSPATTQDTLSPRRLFTAVATAEAVTWALLLTGMFLKYVTDTTEVVVRVGGMLHGAVFLAYCVTTVVVAVDQRWPLGRLVLGLACAVPPFVTVWYERHAERQGLLDDRWRLRADEPGTPVERPTAWLLRHPGLGLLVGLAAVVVLFFAALAVGPPV
ncbi:DUF3817 domain-containing protein [Nocardioides solisilvae]|uniref:DUF3817 domain-containing protein n=1 Tax=Nocardioides solisilvae TaxID=1542435 RepID=UPI001EF50AD2|nr:DUF3817 domain-containing protein [Nocardioides solisilvae]